jgi:hypothetical protein
MKIPKKIKKYCMAGNLFNMEYKKNIEPFQRAAGDLSLSKDWGNPLLLTPTLTLTLTLTHSIPELQRFISTKDWGNLIS